MTNVDHPEWPAITVEDNQRPSANEPLAEKRLAPQVERPMVRAGEVVRIWKHESGLKVEMTGVAEDNGTLGQKVRVRTSLSGAEASPQEITGVVRGAASVEMAR